VIGARNSLVPPGDLCLLVVTCVAYEPLAALTGRIIDRQWPLHPPTFYCGADRASGGAWLPLRDDPADWVGIMLRATRDLRARGYRFTYLLLEDHLPLFRCHAGHLNRTLPALMHQLRATVISLSGWGQGRPQYGRILGPEAWWVEHHPVGFLWKFQLHPGLWSLEALETILAVLVAELPLSRRTPWAFEREAGREDAPLPAELKRGCYRVAGARMSAAPFRRGVASAEKFGVRVLRSLAGRVGGIDAYRRANEVLTFILHYYDGPYPLYRHGVLTKGQLNLRCLRFLAFHGRHDLIREIRDTVQAMAPARPVPNP
jgi:hypothetical protein